jgi:putative molybdopterin biosynthesis protein
MGEKRLLTIKEASEYLGISVKGLYNMVNRRELPFYKIGKRVRFDMKQLDEWIEKHKVESVDNQVDDFLHKLGARV